MGLGELLFDFIGLNVKTVVAFLVLVFLYQLYSAHRLKNHYKTQLADINRRLDIIFETLDKNSL